MGLARPFGVRGLVPALRQATCRRPTHATFPLRASRLESGAAFWFHDPHPDGVSMKPWLAILAILPGLELGAAASEPEPKSGPVEHWAFQRPVRPSPPPLSSSQFPAARNPIDAFLQADQHKHG